MGRHPELSTAQTYNVQLDAVAQLQFMSSSRSLETCHTAKKSFGFLEAADEFVHLQRLLVLSYITIPRRSI